MNGLLDGGPEYATYLETLLGKFDSDLRTYSESFQEFEDVDTSPTSAQVEDPCGFGELDCELSSPCNAISCYDSGDILPERFGGSYGDQGRSDSDVPRWSGEPLHEKPSGDCPPGPFPLQAHKGGDLKRKGGSQQSTVGQARTSRSTGIQKRQRFAEDEAGQSGRVFTLAEEEAFRRNVANTIHGSNIAFCSETLSEDSGEEEEDWFVKYG